MAIRKRGRRPAPRRKGPEHRINEYIRVPQVRVVGSDGRDGVYPTHQARAMAEEQGLDLVEISDKSDPPIVKIIDYTKFLYEQKKKKKEIKAKQHKVEIKEIRFGPNTGEHDFLFKVKHARKFLEEGNKVKTFIHFYGRSIVHKDRSKVILDRFAEELEDIGKIETAPHMEGKRMYMILAPAKS